LVATMLAFNYHLFIVKNDFAPAGLNGIATMIQYKTGFSIGYMSLIINIPLCIIAYFLVDKTFAKRSLFFCLTYSFVYLLLQKVNLSALQYDAQGHDTIFPVILSGVLSGVVYGVCFMNNASTGGTDIVSKYVSKMKPQLNFFYVTFTLNAIVAVTSFFVYARVDETNSLIFDYKPVCLCILYCFISTFVGNYMISGTKKAYKFTIITTHTDEITADIFNVLKHGTTKVEAIGSYNNETKSLLICVINPHQLVDFKKILKKYDNTFSYCETVNETYGNFKRIK
jgi:uncharacterized membrane-anchored protein YitT (DUF2179 family)